MQGKCMKYKKVLAVIVAGAMMMGMSGCGSQKKESDTSAAKTEEKNTEEIEEESDTEKVSDAGKDKMSLEFEVVYSGENLDKFRAVMDGFTEETGIEVNLVAPGADYETVMKTRMASGDMPDLFMTHGWSIARYKEYLADLTSEEWYGKISESILPIISDNDGKIYVLPVTQGVSAIIYNQTVMDVAGIIPEEIRTFDDLMEACKKIRASGIAPFHIGGKDSWAFANIYNVMAPAYYTSEGCAYPGGDELRNGTFDWDANGKWLLNDLAYMVSNDYFNSDFITADESASFEAIGTSKCGFYCGSVGWAIRVKNQFPDAKVGFIPIPATTEEGKSEFMVGEGECFGIWKDSEHLSEAKQLLSYMAESENATAIMEIYGDMPALTDIDVSGLDAYGIFLNAQKAYEGDLYYDNIFDRAYLPNGMYDVMTDAVTEVFMNPTENGINEGVKLLKENYLEKYDNDR